MSYRLWIVPEGVAAIDGRGFSVESLGVRPGPLPLMWTPAQGSGHEGALTVGAFSDVERADRDGVTWLVSDNVLWDTSPEAAEARRRVDEGVSRGLSADTDVDVERIVHDGENGATFWVDAGTLVGATLVPVQAFDGAAIEPDGVDDRTGQDTEEGDEGGDMLEPMLDVDLDAVLAAAEKVVTAAAVADEYPLPPASWFETGEFDADHPEVVWVDADTRAVVAAGSDNAVPWGVPLTITADGRVYGHIANWRDCHIGYPDRCVPPPKSQTGYAYFHSGTTLTADGEIPTGCITVGTGHADHSLSAAGAMAFYDNTGHAASDARAVNGELGPWLSGWVRPWATARQRHELSAHPPSGDWRPIGTSSEMVGVLAVNIRGFQMPQLPSSVATFSHGKFQSLVASGMPTRSAVPDDGQVVSRLERLEAIVEADRLAASL